MSGIDSSSDSVAFDSYSDPFSLFGAWFDEALQVETGEAHAMVLATADAEGRVSSRVVLLKDWGRGGFVFFTNYGSRKARALGENPSAALLFHWRVLGRQVRIEGSVVRASSEVSDAYFASRPFLGALGSLGFSAVGGFGFARGFGGSYCRAGEAMGRGGAKIWTKI